MSAEALKEPTLLPDLVVVITRLLLNELPTGYSHMLHKLRRVNKQMKGLVEAQSIFSPPQFVFQGATLEAPTVFVWDVVHQNREHRPMIITHYELEQAEDHWKPGQADLAESFDSFAGLARHIATAGIPFFRNILGMNFVESSEMDDWKTPVGAPDVRKSLDHAFLLQEPLPKCDLVRHIRATYGKELVPDLPTTKKLAAQFVVAFSELHKTGYYFGRFDWMDVRFDEAKGVIQPDMKTAFDYLFQKIATNWSLIASIEANTVGLAPEVADGTSSAAYSTKSDWFLLGSIIFELTQGQSLLSNDDIPVKLAAILDSDTESLLEGLLCVDPAERNGEDFARAHPFFASIDWNNWESLRLT